MDTLITFVRHGSNDFIKESAFWHPGPKLNKKGIKEAEKTGKYLSDVSFDVVLTSDMNRARQTAEIINKHQVKQKRKKDFKNIVIIRHLAEHDQSIYGKCPQGKKARQEFDLELDKAEKTIKFFKRAIKKYSGKKILIVAHGNVIRACLGFCFGYELRKSPELNLFNCSLSSVFFRKNKLKSVFHINAIDHCHDVKFNNKLASVKFISDYSILVNGKSGHK